MAGDDAGLEEAVRTVARQAVTLLDIREHQGVHPRLGVLDVVPFVPLDPRGRMVPDLPLAPARSARGRFARWAGEELRLPCFCYGPERSLPDVRRTAFVSLAPDTGPMTPHPTAGACAVGARGPLVAYNLWLGTDELAVARRIARQLRGPRVRALGLPVGGGTQTQVSCNLVDPFVTGPAAVYDDVARMAATAGTDIVRTELVGLVPEAVVRAAPRHRWTELDLDEDRTVEARLARIM